MKAWTPDTILQLISLYRSRPVLWDHNHPDIKKNELKQAAWVEIAQTMNRTDVEKKMNILIVQFRREMKKLRDWNEKFQKGETNKALKSKWFAFEAMHFLKDKMRRQKSLSLPVPKDISYQSKRQKKDRTVCVPEMKDYLMYHSDQIANIETECDPVLPYETRDEYAAFGELVAIKIRKLPTASCKNRAMNIITDTLFQLESEFIQSESDEIESDSEYTESVFLKTDVETP